MILIAVDACIVAFSSIMPLALRFGIFTMDVAYLEPAIKCLPVDIIIAVGVLAVFRLYNRVWTYIGIDEFIAVFKASLIIEALYVVYRIFINVDMPRSFYLFNWMFLLLLLSGARASVRIWRLFQKKYRKVGMQRNVMIVGAGAAGSILIKELQYDSSGSKIICMIDDNISKKGKYIHNIPIVGGRKDIPAAVQKYKIEEIIVAIPSASPTIIKEILGICQETDAKLRILPGISSGLKSTVSESIREVQYEDLLGREAVVIRNPELNDFIENQTIMVTGGGGTIGSELCRQIVANHPGKLLIVDIYENGAYDVQQELKIAYGNSLDLQIEICSITHRKALERVFEKYHPQIIINAAAHKHVPLMEHNCVEAIYNNVFGTQNLVELCEEYGAERFMMVSTDKAVNPTNVMGATKRMCEMIVQSASTHGKVKYSATRFGNVLGSAGSVIPLFKRQIANGGPVTVTDKRIIRYFMTIPEASQLVLQSGAIANNGELFVLDMGQPVKIMDLAENMIRLSGVQGIEIIETGLKDIIGTTSENLCFSMG